MDFSAGLPVRRSIFAAGRPFDLAIVALIGPICPNVRELATEILVPGLALISFRH